MARFPFRHLSPTGLVTREFSISFQPYERPRSPFLLSTLGYIAGTSQGSASLACNSLRAGLTCAALRCGLPSLAALIQRSALKSTPSFFFFFF